MDGVSSSTSSAGSSGNTSTSSAGSSGSTSTSSTNSSVDISNTSTTSHDSYSSNDSPTALDALSSGQTSYEKLADEPTTAQSLVGDSQECPVPDLAAGDADSQIDDFHSCVSGVFDNNVIDEAQFNVEGGGCQALSDDAMLCNPAGPEINEYVVGRPSGFPDYIGPDAPNSHLYNATSTSPSAGTSLAEQVDRELAANPTPGDDQTATTNGVRNDAGISPLPDADMVMSSVSTDIEGRQVVSNVTLPDEHILHPGIVSQAVDVTDNTTTINVVGEGNAPLSEFFVVEGIASHVFGNKIDRDMRRAVFADTLQSAGGND